MDAQAKLASDLLSRPFAAKTSVELPQSSGLPKAYGALQPLSEAESLQYEAVFDLLLGHLRSGRVNRPLSLAVFGPPGSGKSFTVKEIEKEVKRRSKLEISHIAINLTQVAEYSQLSAALAAAVQGVPEDERLVVFIDEFDTQLNGAAYGWLSWFLAPMQDGVFLHDGLKVKLADAVLVFAGGTASTFDAFASRSTSREFRLAKGPDFVSRLRGFLNIPGPNSAPRELRRALILRHAIQGFVDQHGLQTQTLDGGLRDALLRAGRYRHGARSLNSIVEMLTVDASKKVIDWQSLSHDILMALQVDRGPLDPTVIGGTIALSGFAPDDQKGSDLAQKTSNVAQMAECWIATARRIWEEGGTLAFGGKLRPSGGGANLLELLAREAELRPPELKSEARRREPFPWLRSFQRFGSSLPEPIRGVEFVVNDYLDDAESTWLASGRETIDNWKARSIERFRRRLAVAESSVARFLVGGSDTVRHDRPSGLAGEIVLSLALGHPIYLAGNFGGAAAQIGRLLGLSSIRTGEVPHLFRTQLSQEHQDALKSIADRMRPAGLRSLPILPMDQAKFLMDCAIGGPAWPNNGLTKIENRQLFESDKPDHVAQLVVKGLLRRFAEPEEQ